MKPSQAITAIGLLLGLSWGTYKYNISPATTSSGGGAAQYYEPSRMPLGTQRYTGVGGGNVPQMSGGDLAQMQPHATPGGQTY